MEHRRRAEYGLVYGLEPRRRLDLKRLLDRARLRPGRVKEQIAMIPS